MLPPAKAMTNKKADAVVAGYMDALAAKRLFHKTLIKPPLELNAKTSSLYSAAMIGFDSISIMIDEVGERECVFNGAHAHVRRVFARSFFV